jgi:type I restriction enzyme, S subunit
LNIDKLDIDKSSWDIVKLGDIASEISVRVDDPAKSKFDRFVGLNHFKSGDLKINRWCTTDNLTSSTKEFRAGDILFARRNAYLKRASVVDFDGVCSGDAFVLRESKVHVVPGFLAFLVNSNGLWEFANANAAGTMSKRVKWRDLAGYEFLLPPLVQQRNLSELLWGAYKVLEKSNSLLNIAQMYKESVIEETLTSHSQENTLIDYCGKDGIKIGPFGSLLHKADYVTEGVPVVMPADIVDGIIQENSVARITPEKADELKNYRLKENDILFPRRGDLSKRALITKKQVGWICGTGTLRVRLKQNVDPEIVFFAVTSLLINKWLLASAVGTTMPNLNVGTIKKIPFHLPEGPNATKALEVVKTTMASTEIIQKHVGANLSLVSTLIGQVF